MASNIYNGLWTPGSTAWGITSGRVGMTFSYGPFLGVDGLDDLSGVIGELQMPTDAGRRDSSSGGRANSTISGPTEQVGGLVYSVESAPGQFALPQMLQSAAVKTSLAPSFVFSDAVPAEAAITYPITQIALLSQSAGSESAVSVASVEGSHPAVTPSDAAITASASPVSAPAPSGEADPELPAFNGSGGVTAGVAASGNQQIDGLLIGTRWSGAITYTDPDSPLDYQAGYNSDQNGNGFSAQNEGFSRFSAGELLASHFALNQAIYTQPAGAGGFAVEAFTNLSVTYGTAGSGTGTIRLANTSDAGTSYAFYPSNSIYGGDVWIGPSARSPVAGNYDWYTAIHEIGHALGLKHGHETGGFGALPSNVDSTEFSVMTYRSFIGHNLTTYPFTTNANDSFPQTWMMLDIQTLQYMYGADYTTNAGNTVYTWATTGESYINGSIAIDPVGNKIYETIWDGGGSDTYDLSNYTTNLSIDLNPGGWSTFSPAQLANIGFYTGSNIYARGNVANALLFGGNTASLIENATGGSGNDVITGNVASNFLQGNGGNDVLNGAGGEDVLWGGDGDDVFVDTIAMFTTDDDIYDGGSGIDTLVHDLNWISTVAFDLTAGFSTFGGNRDQLISIENLTVGGAASVNGSAVANVLRVNGTGANVITGQGGEDTIYGGGGNDTITGGLDVDTVFGEDGDDQIVFTNLNFFDNVDGGAGIDTLDATALTSSGYTFNFQSGQISGYSGIQTLANVEIFRGGSGGDIVVSDGSGEYYGNDGDDYMTAGLGTFETLDGGAGTDTLDTTPFGGGFFYAINMATGATSDAPELYINFENLVSGSTNDLITGTAGNNVIDTGAGNDTILGGIGSDTIFGGDGNDIIEGGFGADEVNGGTGDDTFIVRQGEFGDNIFGNAGIDTLDLSNYTTTYGAHVDISAGTWDFSPSFGGPYTISGVENFIGTQLGDTVIGGGPNNSIFGAAGDDSLSGATGDDLINGDEGVDTLLGGTGNDTIWGASSLVLSDGGDLIFGDAGNDEIGGSYGNDQIDGGADNDAIYGDEGNDTLLGAAGADYIQGDWGWGADLTGADSIDGGTGNDTLLGGAGNDTIMGSAGNDSVLGGDGDDVLYGGGGNDSLIGGLGNDEYTVDSALDVVTENAGEGVDKAFSKLASYTLASNVENLTLNGVGNQSGTGNALGNIITGQSGDNTILGMGGDDSLVGGDGNDNLDGGGLNDTLSGGSGNDSLFGGGGDDSLLGGAGNDSLKGGSGGLDTLKGGAGNDDYEGVDAADVLTEGANQGYDRVFSNVSLTLGNNFEYLELSSGSAASGTGNSIGNTLIGNSNNNILSGLDGADVLYGKSGNDSLDTGVDAVEDQFVFDTALNAATNVDTLFNAQFGEDQVLLDNDIFAALLSNGGTNEGTLSAAYYFEGAGSSGGAFNSGIGVWYNLTSGGLYYNPTSNVAGDSILFAIVSGASATLSNADFTLFTDAG